MQGWEKVFHIKASRICKKHVKTLIWKDESSHNLFCFTYTVPFILQIWLAQEILNVKYVRLLNFYYFKCLSLQWMHLRSSFVSKKHVALLAGTNCAYPSTKLFFNFCDGSLPPKSLKVFQWVNKNDKKSWSKRMRIEISFILWLSYGLILEVNKYFYL